MQLLSAINFMSLRVIVKKFKLLGESPQRACAWLWDSPHWRKCSPRITPPSLVGYAVFTPARPVAKPRHPTPMGGEGVGKR